MRLTAFSLSVVCTFESSTAIFLWSPVTVIVASIQYTVHPSRYRLEALCHFNNVTSYIVFFTSFSCSEISHQCVKTGFSFTSTTLNILEEALVLSIWTSHVISFWTGGKWTSVNKSNPKLKLRMTILWWISHLLWNYTMKSAPNWHTNYIIGFLIINNIHFDTNITILLCLEQKIRPDIPYVVGWPPSWILKMPSQWRLPTQAKFHLHTKN